MSNQILKHPSILHAADVAAICQPLEKLNINYFSHVNVTDNGEFRAVGCNPAFVEHYLTQGYYNNDIHMADNNLLGNLIVWDAIKPSGKSENLLLEAAELGVKHTFTIIEKGLNGTDCYHFASDKLGNAINQVYVTHLDLLKLFVLHFKDKVKQSRELSAAYAVKFKIDNASDRFTSDQETLQENLKLQRKLFLDNIKLDKYMIKGTHRQLTQREMEVLAWMHAGKTASEMATIMGVQQVTVTKHVQMIKEKTGCFTQFQLGEFFSTLFHHSDEIVRHISK